MIGALLGASIALLLVPLPAPTVRDVLRAKADTTNNDGIGDTLGH